ncbi:MAG: class I tRNA ligase family protein [Bacteroidota bacterium]|nr:class I tRNA ligase family protein [Bacteroidota bacterium]
MEYNFRDIESKWQEWWKENKVYKIPNESPKPKYYVLDMFPYPSGAGLHVGHPLGYIASDIYARFKRLKGYNVLHTMGYDAFGLPAEQYAIDHGIHPAVSTEANIKNFRSQLDKIGFCFDWDREVNTSKPEYYKWTQWIFLQLFDSFYNRQAKKAERISVLTAAFEKEGNKNHPIPNSSFQLTTDHSPLTFTAAEWKSFDEFTRQSILMEYRLAYCGIGEVNWCEALGTVLANDEVINGVSERGGHPVVKKKLRQWYLRITEYADRLLEGLEKVDFSEAMKEMQGNWIGKSSGAEIVFSLIPNPSPGGKGVGDEDEAEKLKVYTTRPDTIFGVDFMVIAPEHELAEKITSKEQKAAVEEYIAYVKSRSERERMAEKKITGVFTGGYVIHPFSEKEIPVWISEYVLAGYGTGAIMAVPCGDERDHKFARHFGIPVTNIIGSYYNGEEANPTKDAVLENSDFLDGIVMKDAIEVVIKKVEELGIGVRKVNYKMRDAAFSRQRYWGEPFPIKWINGIAYPLDEDELPLELPKVDSYKPGPDGEGPLANIPKWIHQKLRIQKQSESSQVSPEGGDLEGAGALETNTMPGYAGSSWYFLRYMDPHNEKEFCSRKASDYWNQVDVYIGGTEHAVGHLLYSRMWTKALYDLGYIGHDEPYRKLLNQGMIQGSSRFVYRYLPNYGSVTRSERQDDPLFISKNIVDAIHEKNSEVIERVKKHIVSLYSSRGIVRVDDIQISELHVDVNIVDGIELNIDAFKKWREEYHNAEFILEDGKYICGVEVEKMSKRYFNVVNPDDIVLKYGADTYRMYEMFLGPVEQSKPWETKGIEGVHRFLKKLWRLFYTDISLLSDRRGVGDEAKIWTEEKATEAELKVLHRTIKKIEEDTERFSFNTGVSAFMIAVNELTDLKCHKKEILEPLLILLAPYAPHIAEELYQHLRGAAKAPSFGGALGEVSILDAAYPKFEPGYLVESSKEYPISVNGKLRTTMNISLDAAQPEVEKMVLENEVIKKWTEGKPPKKIIFVKGKMVNVVI